MDSNEYINHCLDVMNADPHLSDETKILMFMEYGKYLLAENNPWFSYKEYKPAERGRYEVYRNSQDKQHYEFWEGDHWRYNNDTITHFRLVLPPPVMEEEPIG